MKSVIGIGTAACSIIDQLSDYDCKEYNFHKISPGVKKNSKYNFKLPHLGSAEEYDSWFSQEMETFLSKIITEKILVFVCGASLSSSFILRALEPLKRRGAKIEIFYFMPDRDILSEERLLQERTIRRVLQQYTRSGVFEKFCLLSNEDLESLAGETNVIDYYKQLNKVFLDSYYMLEVFKNTSPLTSTITNKKNTSRISTLAACTMDQPDRLFYPILPISEIQYHFGINEEKLKNEPNLFRIITNKVKKKIRENTRVSFAIYSTKYEDDYIYAEYFSSEIQKKT